MMMTSRNQTRTALSVGMDYLGKRQMSVAGLTTRLRKKGYPAEEINEAIERLLEWGYLNDRHFTVSYCQTKKDKWSRSRVKAALIKSGIERELLLEILDEVYSGDEEYRQCLAIGKRLWQTELGRLEKKTKKVNTDYDKANNEAETDDDLGETMKRREKDGRKRIRQNVAAKLVMKGYAYSLVNLVMKEISAEIPAE